MHRLFAAILISLALAACVAPPVPRDHFYRIHVPTAQAQPTVFPGIVSVGLFEATGLLRERPILFSATRSQQEMQQHDYHYWNDPPTRMLQQLLAAHLRDSGYADTVVTPGMRIRPDFEIIGKVHRLERILGAEAAKVVAELELAVVRPGGQGLVLVKTYPVERAAIDNSVSASVDALGQAISEIFTSFIGDITATRGGRGA